MFYISRILKIWNFKFWESEDFAMKRFLCVLLTLCLCFPALCVSGADSGLQIVEASGGFESIALEWTNTAPAAGYGVYVKKSSEGAYPSEPIDKELVRYYGNYYRADALGLSAGTYDIKVETADKSASAEAKNINVNAYRREGFGFSSDSPNKSASGGYKDDGTVKDNAQILYITNENVNTVEFTVMDGSKERKYTGLKNILQGYRKDSRPLIIRIIGMIDGEHIDDLVVSDGKPAYIEAKESKDITLEGVGDDATFKWFGFNVNGCTDVEVRNLGVVLFTDDGISLNGANRNVWVHNVDFYYGKTDPSETDKIKGDGALDVKGGSTFCTFSYNRFWDNGKCSLIQSSSKTKEGDGTDFLTYHHNWFDHSDSRHPRTRYSNVHMYNNYYDGNSGYGVGVTSGASVFAENNVFRGVESPMLSSMQGHDESTFSKEAGGIIKAFGNEMTDCGEVWYYSGSSEFDAYLASSREEEVPETVKTKTNIYKGVTFEDTYSNFDTENDLHANPDPVSAVVEDVKKNAGRRGDSGISFDLSNYKPTDTDNPDTAHDIVPELKAMLEAYKSSLVKNYAGTDTEYPSTSGEAPTPGPTDAPKPTAAPEGKYPYEITEAAYEGDSLKVTLRYNGSDKNPAAKLVTAAYGDQGVLTEAKIFDIEGTEIKGLDFKKPQGGTTRIFILNGTEKIAPLCEPKEIK